MDQLREIVKAHMRAARHYQEICELERIIGDTHIQTMRKAELITTMEFYADMKQIIEWDECEH
jgi:hypothetical protein